MSLQLGLSQSEDDVARETCAKLVVLSSATLLSSSSPGPVTFMLPVTVMSSPACAPLRVIEDNNTASGRKELMDAMTMPFEVRDARQMEGVVPGAIVDFVLVITEDGGYATDVRVRTQERGAGPTEGAPAGAAAPRRGALAGARRHRSAGSGFHADRSTAAARRAVGFAARWWR